MTAKQMKARQRREKKKRGNPDSLTMVRPSNFMPDRLKRVLRFNKVFTLFNTGIAYGNVYFIPTFAYDIDPAVSSTAMPGFSELCGPSGTIYTKYRVNKFAVQAEFANADSFNVCVYMHPINVNPGNNSTLYQNFLSNGRSVKTMLGLASGNNVGKLKLTCSQRDFAGYTDRLTSLDPTVGSSGGTAPANNLFFVIGFLAPNGTSVNGIDISMDLEVEIEFFELYSPAT